MTKRTTLVDKTMKRTSQGRRKIEIKRIENANSRQVTFSKRRTGLNNKASELCVLTGAEVLILVESPGNRVFAYGNPNVDFIIGKYLGDESSSNSPENNNLASGVDVNMNQEFNKKFLEISEELEIEKSKSKVVSENNIGEDLCWWEESYENLGLEELEKHVDSLEKLMNNVATRGDEILLTSSIFEPNSNNVDGLVQQGLDNSDQLISSTNQVVPNYVYGVSLNEGSGGTMSDDEDELRMDYSFDQSGTDAHDMMVFGLPTESERSLMERVRQELKIELKQGFRSKIEDVREEILRKRRAGKLPGDTTSVLKEWWQQHSKWPYPTEDDKAKLVEETGLQLKQINN